MRKYKPAGLLWIIYQCGAVEFADSGQCYFNPRHPLIWLLLITELPIAILVNIVVRGLGSIPDIAREVRGLREAIDYHKWRQTRDERIARAKEAPKP